MCNAIAKLVFATKIFVRYYVQSILCINIII